MKPLTTVLTAACALGVMGAATTAKADGDNWHRGGYGPHEHHDYDGRWRQGYRYAPPPAYYYAPQPRYYAQPPVYSYGPPQVYYGPPAGGVYYGP
ncbi:MAG: hypothetical protein M3Y41_09165 [Pseudomonadota bacterium]|nr:hypothetical protein [Pseudomonadota bacterium]